METIITSKVVTAKATNWSQRVTRNNLSMVTVSFEVDGFENLLFDYFVDSERAAWKWKQFTQLYELLIDEVVGRSWIVKISQWDYKGEPYWRISEYLAEVVE